MGRNYGEIRGRMEDVKAENIFVAYAIGMNHGNNSILREKIDDEIMYDFINRKLDIVERDFRARL